MDVLLYQKPVEDITDVSLLGDMAKPKDITNHTSSQPQKPLQRLQQDLREPTVERETIVLSLNYERSESEKQPVTGASDNSSVGMSQCNNMQDNIKSVI